MIDLNKMAKEALAVAEKRKANGANLDNSILGMVKHAHGELVEVVEECCQSDEDDNKKLFGEIADVIMCCLIMARQIWRIDSSDLDIEKALKKCAKKNRLRAKKKGDKL